MKVNAKYFDLIDKEAVLVQETKYGTVEIHSMNQYDYIFNQSIQKGNFSFWSNKGTDTYKLLLEDSFYSELKDLYSKRILEEWLIFYQFVENSRIKALKTQFLPSCILVFLAIGSLLFLVPEKYSDITTYIAIGLSIIFLFVTSFLNKGNGRKVSEKRNETIHNIKMILGNDKFDELLDKQEAFTEKFYADRRKEFGVEEETQNNEIDYTSENTEENKDE